MTTVKLRARIVVTVLALGFGARVSGQTVTTTTDGRTVTTTTEGLTLRQTLNGLSQIQGTAVDPLPDIIGVLTALEVATTPTGTSSGGFVFKLDPGTGLQARSATTFGPSFAERALTSGEGKISISANFLAATYSRLGDRSLNALTTSIGSRPAGSISGDSGFTTSSRASLVLTSKTLVLGGTIGVTDKFDIGVAVPLVSAKLDGKTWIQSDDPTDDNGNPIVVALRRGTGVSSGLGDIAALAKYRLLRFGADEPDPGGLAVVGIMRLPSGDPENLRGIGITRTLASLVFSSGRGRFRPHANVGYERWSKGVPLQTFNTDFSVSERIIRDQIQFGAGMEFEAAPKLTLIADLLGRNVRGAGRVGFQDIPTPNNDPNLPTNLNLAVALPEGLQKLTLAPGLKLNLKGTLLLSINALVALKDNGLHSRFTPVVGLDLTL